MTDSTKAPWHLWVVVALGILWNGFGGFDYFMSQTRNAEYLAQYPPEMIAMLDAMPLWSKVMWALGVWGSVAGTILLLFRSRFAVYAFAVSLLGAVVNFIHGLTQDMPEGLEGPATTIMPIVIVAIIGFQLWYAHRMGGAGVLR